uniref:JAB domain-containing protein n=1 Tax=Eubacterium cellulosolvens TaxID=29322 RepID=UPI0009DF65FA
MSTVRGSGCKDDAYEVCTNVLHMHRPRKSMSFVFCMDSTGKVQGYFEVSNGTVSSSVVSAREIMQKCLLAGFERYDPTVSKSCGFLYPTHDQTILAVERGLNNACAGRGRLKESATQ